MAPRSLKSLRFALMAVLLAGAGVSYAAMYKWIDEDGAITYSNQPPAEPAKARELTKIEEPVPAAKPEPAIAKPEAPGAPQPETTIAKPEAPASKPEIVVAKPEAPVPAPEVVTVKPEAPAPKPEMITAKPEAPPVKADAVTAKPESPAPKPEIVIVKPQTPGASTEIIMVNPASPTAPEAEAPRRVIPRQTHTEAVQDPCLTSSDRNCPQKNAAHYSRYGGYSTTPRPQVAAGATSGAGAAGSVSGGNSTVAPPNWVAPVTPAKPQARNSRFIPKTSPTSTSEVR